MLADSHSLIECGYLSQIDVCGTWVYIPIERDAPRRNASTMTRVTVQAA
jgi:hypothetical protein